MDARGRGPAGVDRNELRAAVRHEYAEVADNPNQGFHFHTGRTLAQILEYSKEQIDRLPESVVESLAGTGNPFAMGALGEGERVIDIGCGAGFDSFIAADMVGPTGSVVGIDMTPEMLLRARAAAAEMDPDHLRFEEAYAEELPVPDGWADVIISNGVLNLCPDKDEVFVEMYRKLKPGGRLQIGDILVSREVPEGAKRNIELWTG